MTYRDAQLTFTHRYFKALLTKHKGNVTRVAEEADRNRTELYRALKRLGLKPRTFRRIGAGR